MAASGAARIGAARRGAARVHAGMKSKILRKVSFPHVLDMYDFCAPELQAQLSEVTPGIRTFPVNPKEPSHLGRRLARGCIARAFRLAIPRGIDCGRGWGLRPTNFMIQSV